MTLKQSMEADADVFFNTDEFGKSAVFSRSGATINVLMEKDIDTDTGVLVDMITVKLSDVAGIQVNDTFTIDAKIYYNVSSDPVSFDGIMATFRVDT